MYSESYFQPLENTPRLGGLPPGANAVPYEVEFLEDNSGYLVVPSPPPKADPATAAMQADTADPPTPADRAALNGPAQAAANAANRIGRNPDVAEQIADQIMLVADGCFANGAVGGLERSEFDSALRFALQRLMNPGRQRLSEVEGIGDIASISAATGQKGGGSGNKYVRQRRARVRRPPKKYE